MRAGPKKDERLSNNKSFKTRTSKGISVSLQDFINIQSFNFFPTPQYSKLTLRVFNKAKFGSLSYTKPDRDSPKASFEGFSDEYWTGH